MDTQHILQNNCERISLKIVDKGNLQQLLNKLQKISNYLIDQLSKIIVLAEGISNCVTLTSLNLSLGSNNIVKNGAKYLGTALSKCFSLTTLNLYLQENLIGENGAKYLGQGLSKLVSLTYLNLNIRTNSVGNNGTNDMEKVFQSVLISILQAQIQMIIVFVTQVYLIQSKEFQTVLLSLLQIFIYVWQNEICEEGTRYLGKDFQNVKILIVYNLYLWNNILNGNGSKYLGEGLSKCQTLTSLNLYLQKNTFSDNGSNYLAEGLSKCLALTFKFKFRGKQYWQLWCKVFSRRTFNRKLILVGDYGVKYLAEGFSKSYSLTSLNLKMYYNKIYENDQRYLREGFSKCSSITSLRIQLLDLTKGIGYKYLGKGLSKQLQFGSSWDFDKFKYPVIKAKRLVVLKVKRQQLFG